MFTLDGIKSDYRIFDIVVKNNKAIIEGVFKNSLNMLVQDDLLTITNVFNDYVPLGILVNFKESMDFKEMGLKPGMKASLSLDMIYIKNILKIGLKNCLWQKQVINKKRIDNVLVDKNLKIVKKVLEKKKINYGLSSLIDHIDEITKNRKKENPNLDPVCKKTIVILKHFFKGLGECRLNLTIKRLEKLIGLGYGTTPSGDDILLGIITSFNYLDYLWPKMNNKIHTQRLRERIRKKTTPVSSKYLIQALEGNISERLIRYMEALLFGKSEKELNTASHGLILVGASSGREIMLGTILALDFHLNKTKNERKTQNI